VTHRILIADDEPAIRRFAARALIEAGYEVLEATDGAAALSMVRSGSEAIDAVVSDVVMPRLTGIELLQLLSASHPDLPCILMSGYAAGQLREMGIAAPCGMLAKPFTAERLVEEVRRCLCGPEPTAFAGGASA
jgi:two-component system cell cycle sensor histidine kinase/response regulator CckA